MYASLDLLAVLFMHYTVFTYFVPLFDLIQFTLHTRYLTYFIFVYRPCRLPFTVNLSDSSPMHEQDDWDTLSQQREGPLLTHNCSSGIRVEDAWSSETQG